MDSGISVRRALPTMAVAMLLIGGCDRSAKHNEAEAPLVNARKGAVLQNVGETPMAERVAVIGLLNKRNGIVRNLTMKPGQAFRIRDVIVRLRACETTAPWESPPLTGAFIQLDVEQPNQRWRRVFSGWLYKESPSLNVVEHPVYDVWPKSCTMSWPGAPGEIAAAPPGPAELGAAASSNKRSSAKKSAGASTAEPPLATEPPPTSPAATEPSATPSNRT
jgi:hypothetical protein